MEIEVLGRKISVDLSDDINTEESLIKHIIGSDTDSRQKRQCMRDMALSVISDNARRESNKFANYFGWNSHGANQIFWAIEAKIKELY
jgi:hypothetical protein